MLLNRASPAPIVWLKPARYTLPIPTLTCSKSLILGMMIQTRCFTGGIQHFSLKTEVVRTLLNCNKHRKSSPTTSLVHKLTSPPSSKGMSSDYVHLFISTLHFPHVEQADLYRLQVQVTGRLVRMSILTTSSWVSKSS